MLEMRVKGICRCAKHPGPSLLLEDAEGAYMLAIGIPSGEMERIAHEVLGSPACEPSIFAALLEALRFLGAEGPTMWLDVGEKDLVGALSLASGGREIAIRCAPRDVAILAAVAHAPVRIGAALARSIEAAQGNPELCTGEDEDTLSEWLDRIRPEDFG